MDESRVAAAAAPVREGGSHQTMWAVEEFVRREHLRIMCPRAAGKLAPALRTPARFSHWDGNGVVTIGSKTCELLDRVEPLFSRQEAAHLQPWREACGEFGNVEFGDVQLARGRSLTRFRSGRLGQLRAGCTRRRAVRLRLHLSGMADRIRLRGRSRSSCGENTC